MSLVMTKEEREAFLADVHVGIISNGRVPKKLPQFSEQLKRAAPTPDLAGTARAPSG